ncbi:hypothetical protein AX14_002919 [Amanita brunnescens Koide BX004]|nr:hypothetical protein AX14_002919 [Amanita brunnescens Koide BX004]
MATFLFKGTIVKLDSWLRKGRNIIRWKHVDAVPPRQSEESLSTSVQQELRFERQLGDTELSYYLPSRGDGVNDMYLQLGCQINPALIVRDRVCLVWAIMRLRHPLLASTVRMNDYHDVRFGYTLPENSKAALSSADHHLEYRSHSHDLVDSYLNGPRTLSNERLSYLIVNLPNSQPTGSDEVDCDFLICATHFLGDGMALHQFANDFFSLLGGDWTTSDLSKILDDEICNRRAAMKYLPKALEDRLPPTQDGHFQRAAKLVDYHRSQEKNIGGQAFPRQSGSPRKTVVHNEAFDAQRTKAILKKCKAQGVSVSSALFAACNLAWARTSSQSPELPSMMYSALNVRPNLLSEPSLHDSYWFIAIGYFNVILPSFFPASADVAPTFWHRSREAKKQSTAAMKNPMLISRCRQMARERSERAQTFARQDDGEPVKPTQNAVTLFGGASERPPSKALIGLSLLGNLDATYKHATYPGIRLHTLTTGSRQRSGGMLLFGYTFAGKLWISLSYDENGFDKSVVETFWNNVLQVVDTYMS